MPNWLVQFAIPIIKEIFVLVSPLLKKELDDFALDFYEKAKTTKSAWDDVAAAVLMQVLGLDTPTTEIKAQATVSIAQSDHMR